MQITTVGVVGAGQMGRGIAQVCASAGYITLLTDAQPHMLTKATEGMTQSLQKLHKLATLQGQLNPELPEQTLTRLTTTPHEADLASADVIIEAIVEDEAAKCALFSRLHTIVQPHALFASNTSSISITRLARASQRPGQFMGMHFMNPVPLMKLVELINGAQTLPQTHTALEAMARQLGKTPVTSQDFPGFISNRILMPMINEAICTLHEGVGTVEAIDTVMTLGMNHPMGPLKLADFIGLDTILFILDILFKGFGDTRYRPCPLLKQYVDAGYLGKKSGRGFYTYQ
jgi:3-hydroxybutyryl-CoA dehydrogenase